MNVVDSSAWLSYFAGEPNASYFSDPIEDTDILLVPSICIYEVFKVILREKDEDTALELTALMQQGFIVDIDSQIAIEAAALGHEKNLALADSIIYHVTLKNNALLWTQDAHFENKKNVCFKRKE